MEKSYKTRYIEVKEKLFRQKEKCKNQRKAYRSLQSAYTELLRLHAELPEIRAELKTQDRVYQRVLELAGLERTEGTPADNLLCAIAVAEMEHLAATAQPACPVDDALAPASASGLCPYGDIGPHEVEDDPDEPDASEAKARQGQNGIAQPGANAAPTEGGKHWADGAEQVELDLGKSRYTLSDDLPGSY